MRGPCHLVVLRHGQSEWNAAGIFTGWENAHLTTTGEREAIRAGTLLAEYGALPAFVHISLQQRTIRTADFALTAVDRDGSRCAVLGANRAASGAKQGRNKTQVLQEYGEQQFMLWRRSYHALAPLFSSAAEAVEASDPRYEIFPPEARPHAESLRDVFARLLPGWERRNRAGPAGRRRRPVVRTATRYGRWSSTWTQPRRPDRRTGPPHGVPLIYQLGPDLRPDALGGQDLDPHAARDAIELSGIRGASWLAGHQEVPMNSRPDDEAPRIVVGVDGFESSTAALRWAIHQAKLTGAVVEAATAWQIPVGTRLVPATDMPDYQDDARMVLTEAITQMCMIDAEVEVRPRVVEGRAAQVLLDAAEGAELLVLGSRGHGGLAEALLGSVGQYCVHHAPCPVVIMRGKY